MNYLIKIFIITIFISLKLSANENENKILFKINNKVVTNVDFERRINYLQTTSDRELAIIQQASFDERTLPFADTVVRNMEARPEANILLNQLYGGVPPVTVSDMTSYITGEWIV